MENIDTYLVDHLELLKLEVYKAFVNNNLTTEQYTKIIDILVAIAKHEIYKTTEGGK